MTAQLLKISDRVKVGEKAGYSNSSVAIFP